MNGGAIVAEHLINLGRTRISIIVGDPTYKAASDRVKGALSTLETHGIKPVHRPIYGGWTEDWGSPATGILMDKNTNPDAIICGSDQIARGCLERLQSKGVQIPDGIAVSGYDNWNIFVESTHLHLTSVDNQLEKLARLRHHLLLMRLMKIRINGVQLIPCRLFARESTLSI